MDMTSDNGCSTQGGPLKGFRAPLKGLRAPLKGLRVDIRKVWN